MPAEKQTHDDKHGPKTEVAVGATDGDLADVVE